MLNQVKNSEQPINAQLIQDTAELIAQQDKYNKYTTQLNNAVHDITEYFNELELYGYLTRVRDYKCESNKNADEIYTTDEKLSSITILMNLFSKKGIECKQIGDVIEILERSAEKDEKPSPEIYKIYILDIKSNNLEQYVVGSKINKFINTETEIITRYRTVKAMIDRLMEQCTATLQQRKKEQDLILKENELNKSLAKVTAKAIIAILEPIWYKWTIGNKTKMEKIKNVLKNYSKDTERQAKLKSMYRELSLQVHPDKVESDWKQQSEARMKAINDAYKYIPDLLKWWTKIIQVAIDNNKPYIDLPISQKIGKAELDNTERSMLAMFAEQIIFEGRNVYYAAKENDCKTRTAKAIAALCNEISHKGMQEEIEKFNSMSMIEKRKNAIFLEQTLYNAMRNINTDKIIKRLAEEIEETTSDLEKYKAQRDIIQLQINNEKQTIEIVEQMNKQYNPDKNQSNGAREININGIQFTEEQMQTFTSIGKEGNNDEIQNKLMILQDTKETENKNQQEKEDINKWMIWKCYKVVNDKAEWITYVPDNKFYETLRTLLG